MSLVPRPTDRPMPGTDDGMIPMINIVFLLLVFFMIAGQIAPRDPAIDLPASTSAGELATDQVVISIDADGALRVDGRAIDGELSDHLAPLFADSGTAPPALTCRAHRSLPVSALDPVLAVARGLPVTRLQIVTEWQP